MYLSALALALTSESGVAQPANPPASTTPVTTPAAPVRTALPPAAAASSTMIETQRQPMRQVQAVQPRVVARPVEIEHGPNRKLVVGEVNTIGLQGVSRIAIGNGAIIKATVVDDRQIVLLAEAAGETTMHVWLKNGRQFTYQLTVDAVRGNRVLEELQELIKEVPGVKARLVGERVVMEGRYPDNETASRLKKLSASFPQVLNLIADKPSDADPLLLDRMVQIDLRVVEVKKRALDQLGIKWAGSINGPTVATNALGFANTPWRPAGTVGFPPVNTANPIASYAGLATQLTSAINLLEQNGDAWTLAEPRLSCRSGGQSAFLAGGEIPIPVSQGFGAIAVEYKPYGVKINFSPVADGSGNIDSTLLIEVSEPDTRNSNGGFVAFTTNRTETQVALKESEPLIIAGLLRQRAERASDGLPGLNRLPLISYLFKSVENTTEQTELFIIATPRVITPESSLNRDAIDEARERARQTSERAAPRLNPTARTGDVERDK